MLSGHEFLVILSFVTFVLAVLCSIILVAFPKKNPFPNIHLAFGFVSLAFVVLTNTFNYTDIFLRFPHLFRIAFPIQYLIPVFFYFYVRSTLYQEKNLRANDWIFFVPAILHLVEMIPFYFSSAEDKAAIIEQLLKTPAYLVAHREGTLPAFVHPFLKATWGLTLAFFSLELINSNKSNFLLSPKKRKLCSWLYLFTIALSIFYILIILVFTFRNALSNLVDSVNIPIMFALLTVSLFLFFWPAVLYGQNLASNDEKIIQNSSTSRFSLTDEQIRLYEQQLISYFKEKRPYLKSNYRINQLSKDLDIPTHHLSLFINEHYGLSYSNFINRARIDYLVLTYSGKNHLQVLTLEGIAKEAGFTSRNTFIRAFKKYIGVTPSDFFL